MQRSPHLFVEKGFCSQTDVAMIKGVTLMAPLVLFIMLPGTFLYWRWFLVSNSPFEKGKNESLGTITLLPGGLHFLKKNFLYLRWLITLWCSIVHVRVYAGRTGSRNGSRKRYKRQSHSKCLVAIAVFSFVETGAGTLGAALWWALCMGLCCCCVTA